MDAGAAGLWASLCWFDLACLALLRVVSSRVGVNLRPTVGKRTQRRDSSDFVILTQSLSLDNLCSDND